MEVIDGHVALSRTLISPTVAIGNFDGVHIGHQHLFARTVELARNKGGDAAVFTFEPHPAQLLAPNLAPALITPLERKLELIGESGIDLCIVEPFTAELAALAPDLFLDQVLVAALKVTDVVVGYDFSYGSKRAGTIETLTAHGRAHGYCTHVIRQVTADGLVASSTKVRSFAQRGKLEGIVRLLGRDLDVDGVVVRGAGRGRQIGVPTANIQSARNQLLPRTGVYAVTARLLDEEKPDRVYPGVANLGTNPTFVEAGETSLEVHLLDFDRDLYGQKMRVLFRERLRGERRFNGVAELVSQIEADIRQTREILADTPTSIPMSTPTSTPTSTGDH